MASRPLPRGERRTPAVTYRVERNVRREEQEDGEGEGGEGQGGAGHGGWVGHWACHRGAAARGRLEGGGARPRRGGARRRRREDRQAAAPLHLHPRREQRGRRGKGDP